MQADCVLGAHLRFVLLLVLESLVAAPVQGITEHFLDEGIGLVLTEKFLSLHEEWVTERDILRCECVLVFVQSAWVGLDHSAELFIRLARVFILEDVRSDEADGFLRADELSIFFVLAISRANGHTTEVELAQEAS